MPSEITKYKCDLCGETYETKLEAEQCESNHRSFMATPYYKPLCNYPYKIVLTFSDGAREAYYCEET